MSRSHNLDRCVSRSRRWAARGASASSYSCRADGRLPSVRSDTCYSARAYSAATQSPQRLTAMKPATVRPSDREHSCKARRTGSAHRTAVIALMSAISSASVKLIGYPMHRE